jgi:pimeloyl-ACP methyl ester carboxylesterase
MKFTASGHSLLFACLLQFFVTAHGTELIFENEQFSFQALRTAGYTVSGCADLGECLTTCYRIVDGDTESWYAEWLHTAERTLEMADSYLEQGFQTSARECYFRASGYYRAAEFFLHTEFDDPRMLRTWEMSRDAFLAGAVLSENPIIPVEIPLEEGYISAYLCLVDESGAVRPMILSHSGFDGTKEELYFSLGRFAVERGYNCLLFEGPGQGEVIRVQGIHFRPDWESVVTPVVDYVLSLTYVDQDRIALVGYSMGGYLAPRAVAYEHRIAACVANGAVYSMYESAKSSNPPGIDEILDDEEASREYDQAILDMMNDDLFVKWFYTNGMWTFGADSPGDFMRMMRAYTLAGCVDDITCSMLLLDSQNDQLVGGQATVLYDSLQCPKEYILFTEDEGADEHCQMGAILVSNEKIFNWLDREIGDHGSR